MALEVKCPLCGTVITGADEDTLVANADAHGDAEHQMRAPRFMIVGAAKHVDD
ncbi:MAG: hypothetical protein ACYDGM_14425 [Vulcanimicrobiaceae bacterium]